MKHTPRRSAESATASEMALIQKKMGYLTLEAQPREWLDTGSKLLNAVFGSEEKGIAYGKLIELFGPESNGKSLLALLLISLAQADGADVAWLDFENSLDKAWAERQGVDWAKLYHFYPKLIRVGKAGKPRLQTAEELCKELEFWMERRHHKGSGKLFIVTDSVAAMLVEEEAAAGVDEQNMRTRNALPMFLSQLLRRWVALAQVYNCSMCFINQLRASIGTYGKSEDTPGGRALKFYASVRVGLRRVKGGKLLQKGKMVGLKGVMRNFKNKSGENSLEGQECGFKAYFLKNDWRFLSSKKLRKEQEEAGEVE